MNQPTTESTNDPADANAHASVARVNPLGRFLTRSVETRTGERADSGSLSHSSFGLNGGMEIALALVLFLAIGLAIDSWLGTKPVFALVLFILGAVASGVRMYFQYTYEMTILESQRRERAADVDRRRSGTASHSVRNARQRDMRDGAAR